MRKRITASRPSVLKRLLLLGRQSSVAVVVARCLIGRFLRIAHGREFRFAGIAAVGQSPIEQGLDRFTMLTPPVRSG